MSNRPVVQGREQCVQAKEDATELQAQSKALKEQIAAAEVSEETAATQRDKLLGCMGNLVHDSVPVDQDEVCSL